MLTTTTRLNNVSSILHVYVFYLQPDQPQQQWGPVVWDRARESRVVHGWFLHLSFAGPDLRYNHGRIVLRADALDSFVSRLKAAIALAEKMEGRSAEGDQMRGGSIIVGSQPRFGVFGHGDVCVDWNGSAANIRLQARFGESMSVDEARSLMVELQRLPETAATIARELMTLDPDVAAD